MIRKIHSLLIPALLSAMILLVGCSDKQSDNVETAPDSHAVEDGHEGHNHTAGEHAHATPSSDDMPSDWCAEHDVPESQCTRCNPVLIADYKESGDWCAGHGLPESHCRLCNPGIVFPQEEILRAHSVSAAENEIGVSLNFRPNASVCATDGAVIRFASVSTAERVGMSVHTARLSEMESVTEAPAEIVFDETRSVAVTSTVAALVTRWQVSPGDVVRAGEVLAILQSPDIAQLRSALITTGATYQVEQKELERHEQMRQRELVSDADFERQAARTEQARAEYVSARGLLRAAGLSESDLDELLTDGALSNQFALRAPYDGLVIERSAGLGELLAAGSAFATIGDPRAMWIEARLSERQMQLVDLGRHMTFSSDGSAANRVGGEIIWISSFLDPHTRTGTVRARVIDPNHTLHAGEFGRVRITANPGQPVVLVPRDAVQWEGCCNVVFVREAIDRYRPRKVRLVESDGPFYQVTEGLQAGEEVVVDGAFLLKTELKKSSIGAGCCGLEPVG